MSGVWVLAGLWFVSLYYARAFVKALDDRLAAQEKVLAQLTESVDKIATRLTA